MTSVVAGTLAWSLAAAWAVAASEGALPPARGFSPDPTAGPGPGPQAGWFRLMPPHPDDPRDYICQWDSCALRPPAGRPGRFLAVTNRNHLAYDLVLDLKQQEPFPLVNGRQIARDGFGNWFVLVGQDASIYLAAGRGSRIEGRDLSVVELAGRAGGPALLAHAGPVTGASMVVDRANRLHLTWCSPDGLWYLQSTRDGRDLGLLLDGAAWSEPSRIAEGAVRPGDLLVDASGAVALCYALDDSVYFLSMAGERAEVVAGQEAGEPLPGVDQPRGDLRLSRDALECQGAVMDQAPDGTLHLAFQRGFRVYATRRPPGGAWAPAECAAQDGCRHPSLMVTGGQVLLCFQQTYRWPATALRNPIPRSEHYLRERDYGGSSVGYAVRTDDGWRQGTLAETEEIIVDRRGIWGKAQEGQALPMMEAMERPALLRDPRGVVWALWQNTTRRWAYCARWMGDGFGQVQECRGPFDAPGRPALAEKAAPVTADDVGMLFVSAHRVLFDRLEIPTLSQDDEREILFLDSLEVAAASGVEFVLNPMAKHPANPVLAPGAPGSKDDKALRVSSVRKHGTVFVMEYACTTWAVPKSTFDTRSTTGRGWALSEDGIHWRKVDQLPANLPPPDPHPHPATRVGRENDRPGSGSNMPVLVENPDASDPAKKYVRLDRTDRPDHPYAPVYRVQYSPDGQQWADGPEVSIVNALREQAMPNFWDPRDVPERRIKIYGRGYSASGRSCAVIWSPDLLHWGGVRHFLDVDDPYGKPALDATAGSVAYPMGGRIFLDACAGKREREIYTASVELNEGLYFAGYWLWEPRHQRAFRYALAVSRDGLNFTRVKNGERTLAAGPVGSWDSGTIVFHFRYLQEGDNLRVYYDGMANDNGSSAIGLATIRVNGWTYYTRKADAARGSVTTIPVTPAERGTRGLTVNVEGAGGRAGAFAAGVLDAATGTPLPGYSAADCLPLAGDGLAVPVAWKGGPRLPRDRDIRVRFHLNAPDVKLYSFGFR